ncbi:Rossmann-like and DUF2520 domain-containing protein [Salinimicrobium soli]|uniref:Rossmann-like and DUF2520 domain-containing protein n=1 Tax=Salinimicrobium soli TaxID=1254399 RepID=UPI003AAC7A50
MIDLVLLGTGNVATHLFKAFSASKEVNVVQVYNHSEESLKTFKETTAVTTSLGELAPADVYLLALKDDAIPEVAEKLENCTALVAHTSGAVEMDMLQKCSRRGVFYPLQTFSKEKTLDYSEIPFCLEANSSEDLELLKKMAIEISGKAYEISSAQRKKIHLSAVFVCNFVNHLYAVGEKICRENEIPFEILQPLIKETAAKIQNVSPAEVQTGPAIRNDRTTITAHLEQLNDPENKKIYELLTHAIQKFHGKEL